MKRLFSLMVMTAVSGVLGLSAQGAILGFDLTQPTNSPPLTGGSVTNDIAVDFTGNLNSAALLIELTSGSIYQNAFGTDTAPNSALIPAFPEVAFDSFVTLGGYTTATADAVPGFAGGAVDLGGAPGLTFDTALIDVSFFVPGGTTISNQLDYPLARVTLTDDAVGTWSMIAVSNGTESLQTGGIVSNGQMVVPEPAGLLALLAGLPLMLRRNR